MATLKQVLGGFSPPQPPDTEVQVICDRVKCTAEWRVGGNFQDFTAIQYRVKLAAVKIYLIKAHTGGSAYIDLRVNEELPSNNVKLVDIRYPVNEDSPLEPF